MKLRQINKEDNYEAWQEAKFDDIGSSDIPTIMGLNAYQTAQELWDYKKGRVPMESSFKMRLGSLCEGIILERTAHDYPHLEIKGNQNTYEHDKFPFLTASPDSFITDNGKNGICECKTTIAFGAYKDNKCPEYVTTQVNWQLGILELPFGLISAMVGGNIDKLNYRWWNFSQELFDAQMAYAIQFKQDLALSVNPYVGNVRI